MEDATAPYERMMQVESRHNVYAFCSLCSLIKNRRHSVQKVFGLVLTDERYRRILKEMLSTDNDIDTLREFLKCDEDGSIAKSKYIAGLVRGF